MYIYIYTRIFEYYMSFLCVYMYMHINITILIHIYIIMYIYNLQLYTYVNHQKGLCVSFGPAMQQKGWTIEGPWRWTRLSKYGIQNDQLLSCSSANLRQGLLSPWNLKGFHRVSHAARSVPHRSWSERSSIISKMQSADTSYGISRELEASSPTSRVTVSPHRKVLILRTATVVRCPLRWSNIRSSFLHVLRRVFETDSLAPRGKCECYSSCTSHACPFLARWRGWHSPARSPSQKNASWTRKKHVTNII